MASYGQPWLATANHGTAEPKALARYAELQALAVMAIPGFGMWHAGKGCEGGWGFGEGASVCNSDRKNTEYCITTGRVELQAAYRLTSKAKIVAT